MGLYYSKEGLYNEIGNIKEFLGLYRHAYGFDLVNYCTMHGIIIETVPFKTQGLRGMAVVGNGLQEDIILLNSSRSKCEQNFDCGHEMIHLCLHRNLGQRTFNCFDTVRKTQNHFVEWHANEGAAELFVPYEVFLPLVKEKIGNSTDYSVIENAKTDMANIFKVPNAVITFRLENLKYEINQFLNGTPLDKIEILSHKQQEKRNIKVLSLNDISDNDFMEKYRYWTNDEFSIVSMA